MPSVKETRNETHYWQSLEEYASTDDFKQFVMAEFPTQAELVQPGSRRRFLQLMGASLSLAGLTACRWPKEKILPYSNRPDNMMPGVPDSYTSAMDIAGYATGLLVTSYDGRPIKVDGNPTDPNSSGASNAWAQASVLELYDPERSKSIIRRDGRQEIAQTWDDLRSFIKNHFDTQRNNQGNGLCFLSETSSSPSVQAMKNRVRTVFPRAKWFEYEPVCNTSKRQGANLAYGIDLRAHYNIDKAKVILSLDEDLFGSNPAGLKLSKDFAGGRNAESGEMNRLYAVESTYTVTGAAADHRLPLRPKQVELFTLALAGEILINQGLNLTSDYEPLKGELARFAEAGLKPEFIKALAKDLVANRGKGLIVPGAHQTPMVHAVAYMLNEVLGNVGSDKPLYFTTETPDQPDHVASILALTEEMKTNRVNTLVILGGNPVYDAPADLEFASNLESVQTTIHLSLYDNETSKASKLHVPRAHYLESWGDARGYDWSYLTAQPLIEPLYGGLSVIEFLALVTGHSTERGYDIVRESVQAEFQPAAFESFWRKLLHDGVAEDTTHRPKSLPLEVAKILNAVRSIPVESNVGKDNLEIAFVADSSVYDGRYSNSSWLQEVPDFITKITWDNAAYISIHTAQELGIENEEIIKVRYKGRELDIAVYLLPGQPDYTITLPLGYGRTAAGEVGNGTGFNTYTLRTSDAVTFDTGATLEKTGDYYELACTQDHFLIDSLGMKSRQDRIPTLIREADLEEYKEHPDFAKHVVHVPKDAPLWKQFEYDGYKWGLAIDLNTCTGCNACVVACQAENNIPVVGKENVLRGREMHWLRIDRYFKGEPDAPEVVHQPMACVQCENAPCEQVCPVAATMHDSEGLNVMVYNRCIGTRYCSNNCPFKVRRFNFFNYHKGMTETEQMVYNPEVTVRARGVMEKCTYCTQRIQKAKIVAKNERRQVRDGEIVTACAQSCPTGAITFGDLNDPNSAVSKLHANSRSYTLLDELYIKPRTAYLARVTNPNPELIEA